MEQNWHTEIKRYAELPDTRHKSESSVDCAKTVGRVKDIRSINQKWSTESGNFYRPTQNGRPKQGFLRRPQDTFRLSILERSTEPEFFRSSITKSSMQNDSKSNGKHRLSKSEEVGVRPCNQNAKWALESIPPPRLDSRRRFGGPAAMETVGDL